MTGAATAAADTGDTAGTSAATSTNSASTPALSERSTGAGRSTAANARSEAAREAREARKAKRAAAAADRRSAAAARSDDRNAATDGGDSTTVDTRSRRTTVTAAGTTQSDPVLVAAATSTKVTVGSMMVDRLYARGVRSERMGTDWLDIPVSQATASRWLVKRANIYRDVVIPTPSTPTVPTNPTNPTNPTTPSDPKLLWETNFSSMAETLKYWGLQTGRWGQSAGENQYYTNGDNISIDSEGHLVIQARRQASPDKLGAPNNYTSARLSTMGKQSISVGTRVVARIKMPVNQGALPAFWSVGLEPGHEYDWPRQGEIDIVELPGFGTPSSRQFWTGNIHGPSKRSNTVDVKTQGIGKNIGVDLSQDFHEYGISWYPDRITWDVDGVKTGEVTKAQYEALGGDWTPFSGAWDHYLILNVAVGNPWTGDPDPSTPFQADMTVDWVKAYRL